MLHFWPSQCSVSGRKSLACEPTTPTAHASFAEVAATDTSQLVSVISGLATSLQFAPQAGTGVLVGVVVAGVIWGGCVSTGGGSESVAVGVGDTGVAVRVGVNVGGVPVTVLVGVAFDTPLSLNIWSPSKIQPMWHVSRRFPQLLTQSNRRNPPPGFRHAAHSLLWSR